MVRITGTRYCGTFCQEFVQYLDLSSRSHKTMPRLTVLTKRLHCCRPRRRTSSGRSTGHQTAWISIRLTTRSGAFCKSECAAAGSVTSTIWTRKPCCRKETARCCKCSFRSKFANHIPYKYKTSHASKATLQSSKHAGAKHNLTQNQDSKSIKVTCLESVEKQWGNK